MTYCKIVNHRRIAFGAVCSLLVFAIGCGSSYDGPKLYPLTGKITVNGQPPGEQFRVLLVASTTGTPEPQLLVQEDGSYIAMTGAEGFEGAVAGKFKVIVVPQLSGEAAYAGGAAGGGQPTLPEELAAYATAETSPTEIEVTTGTNAVDITIP